jgi:hypothetical protein
MLSFTLVMACKSQESALRSESTTAAAQPAPRPASAPADPYAGDSVSLDEALSDIAAYYRGSLPANAAIALLDFESEARLLSDYIFEELWIHFEAKSSFVMVERQHLERIQKELEYQASGMVSDESVQSIGHQFGSQILVYGKISRLGGEYRLVVHATDVERAVTSIRSAAVLLDPRLTALLETPSGGVAGMANALYSGTGNPWRFTVQTDRPGGDYRDGDFMTLRIYSEKDAWFKVTHIDVNGSAQVIYPVSPQDNNFIRAGETRQIPDHTRFRMTTPYGEEMVLVDAYERSFAVQHGNAAPLSNRLLVRGILVESKDTQTDMRPVVAAKFTYRIGP